MKMKNKGLGRIPKSLSWIGAEEELSTQEAIHTPQPESFSVKTSSFAKATADVTEDKAPELKLAPATTKALAYWDRLTVKEVMHEALSLYFQDKNVKPIPKKRSTI